jgi:integrase
MAETKNLDYYNNMLQVSKLVARLEANVIDDLEKMIKIIKDNDNSTTLGCIDFQDIQNKTALWLLFTTGLRPCNIIHMNDSELKFENNQLMIISLKDRKNKSTFNHKIQIDNNLSYLLTYIINNNNNNNKKIFSFTTVDSLNKYLQNSFKLVLENDEFKAFKLQLNCRNIRFVLATRLIEKMLMEIPDDADLYKHFNSCLQNVNDHLNLSPSSTSSTEHHYIDPRVLVNYISRHHLD